MRLGTRRSALALAQAQLVATALGDDVEVVGMTTTGDRDPAEGDKSRWVAELERALSDGEIDLAVHSAKDVPGELADGLEIAAVPDRADPRDALCGVAALEDLRPGARVGTSSLRRHAQLRAARGDLELVELRGNVDTRLRKLQDGEADALVLAAAGLARLGRADAAGALLEPPAFIPAPGQGALAVEARAGDEPVLERLRPLNDESASVTLRAERAVVRALQATCRTPVGAHATLDAGALTLSVFVGLPDGSAWVRDEASGPTEQPEELGAEVAERVALAGGRELLERAERWATEAGAR